MPEWEDVHSSNPWSSDRPVSEVVPWDDGERAALVALLRLTAKGTSWSDVVDRIAERGSAQAEWDDQHPASLFGSDDAQNALQQAVRDVQRWATAPFEFHTFMDPSYPEKLRSVWQMPPVLFTRGKLIQEDLAVSVVGSRKASARGLKFADEVARQLVGFDVTVVAGLAEGIDTVAHEAALDSGGRTVAVLGNGIDYEYPKSNAALQETIADRGLLLTQFMPEFRPTKWSFPARNAVMSAYSAATVIVEATEFSGTRTQAREAINHGRAVILSAAVAQGTKWGSALVGAPGVHVASTPGQALEQLETMISRRWDVDRLLSGVV